MKNRKIEFHISLYVLVPFIFSGIAFFSSISSFHFAQFIIQNNKKIIIFIIFMLILVVVTYVCGFLIVRFILKPAEEFVERAKQIPVFSDINSDNKQNQKDQITNFNRFFDHVTDVLSKIDARQLFPEIIGISKAIRAVLGQVTQVAASDATVLILGESGTGKELIAQAIVNHSIRKDKPFIKLNCGAVSDSLLESEMFGYEKGSFTGAMSQRKGKLEIADKGTIFLDEIGDMPLNLQVKLLRVLQEKEFYRVGGNSPVKIDVRIITATNKDIEQMVKDGTFREDLYYRLNVFSIIMPCLRERKEDILPLSEYFLQTLSYSDKQISQSALQFMFSYEWPGNIRELRNTIERAALLSQNKFIEPEHLPDNIKKMSNNNRATINLKTNQIRSIDFHLREMEKRLIMDALEKNMGVQARAAESLGITQRSLWNRIKKYNIDVRTFKSTNNGE